MSSPVDVCNLALSWLSGNHITSLDDPQQEARICKAVYDRIRKSLLNTGHFAFASRRTIYSTPLTEVPEWGYDFAFKIPTDVLKVTECYRDTALHSINEDSVVEWAQVGDEIHTNWSLVLVSEIVDVTNVDKWSNLFEQAMAARIAADICLAITQNRSMQADMWSLFESKMNEASGQDNQIHKKNTQATSRLILARGRSTIGITRGNY